MMNRRQNKERSSNKLSSHLTNIENQVIVNMLGQECSVLCGAVAQLLVGSTGKWTKRSTGVVVIVEDSRGNSSIRFCDMVRDKEHFILQQDISLTMKYKVVLTYFHTFLSIEGQIGLNFAYETEATHLKSVVKDILRSRLKRADRFGWTPDPTIQSCLASIGLDRNQLEDDQTQNFIFEFIENNGGVKELMSNIPQRRGRTRGTRTKGPAPPPPVQHSSSGPPSPSRRPPLPPKPSHLSSAPIPPPTPPPSFPSSAPIPPPPPPPPFPFTSGAPPPPPPPPPPSSSAGSMSSQDLWSQLRTTRTLTPLKTDDVSGHQIDQRTALNEEIASAVAQKKLRPVQDRTLKPLDSSNGRSAMLQQIKEGVKLKKTSGTESRKSQRPQPNSPTDEFQSELQRAIQSRRFAIVDDSDAEEEEDDEIDDEEWRD